MDTSKVNLYDTDTWYTVRQIGVLSNGGDISYDKLLMYPEGRGVDWGSLLPYLLAPFSNESDTPLQTFNRFAWGGPIASIVFSIIIFLMVSRLYGEIVGLYSTIFISVGSWVYLQNCLYGIIDHHILEVIFFTLSLLSLILLIKERNLIWGVLIGVSIGALFFTSTLWSLYYCIFFLAVFLAVIHTLWNHNKLFASGFVILTGIVGVYFFQTYLYSRFSSLLSWSEPIVEIAHTSPLTLLMQYNILILPLVVGITKIGDSLFKIDEMILILVSAIFLMLTLQFTRMGYMLFPIVAILSAYYIDKEIARKYKMWVVGVFVISMVVFGAITISEFADTTKNNRDMEKPLEYLSIQPQGLVLSWWNDGHWIVSISHQPPFTDPFQDRLTEASTIFTANISQAQALLKRYDIRYILVSEDDMQFYDTMVWYSKSQTPYDDSYLNEIISNESYSFKNGKIKVFTV